MCYINLVICPDTVFFKTTQICLPNLKETSRLVFPSIFFVFSSVPPPEDCDGDFDWYDVGELASFSSHLGLMIGPMGSKRGWIGQRFPCLILLMAEIRLTTWDI